MTLIAVGELLGDTLPRSRELRILVEVEVEVGWRWRWMPLRQVS